MKFHIWTAFFCLLVLSNLLYGQSIKKDKAKAGNKDFSYYYIQPEVKVKGVVILLTGAGERSRSVFNKTDLPKVLTEKGYVTIVPEISNSLIIDQHSFEVLDVLVETQCKKYNAVNVIIGGFSAGGATATSYAEYVLAKDSANNLTGLIAIDPPLDSERLYASAERNIKNCDGIIKKQGYAIKNQLNNALGGSPKDHPNEYLKHSSYSASAADGGNAKYLKNLAIRLYSEPDLDFVQRTYCSALQFDDINSTDLEGLSKFLLSIGNTRSEYITTKGKGFHSWNIVDATECADWIVRLTE